MGMKNASKDTIARRNAIKASREARIAATEITFFPDHPAPMERMSRRVVSLGHLNRSRDDRPGIVYTLTYDAEGNWTETKQRWDGFFAHSIPATR